MNLVGLPLLCVEAHAQTQGIDREREHNCRALLSRDRIERLKQASSETQENQVESVMFFCFFCLAKDQASNKQKRNRNSSLTCDVACLFFLQNTVLENEQLWLVILFVSGGGGNRNWGHTMLKLSGWISTSSIGFQPRALVGSARLDSDRMNFAKKIPARWGHRATSLNNSGSRASYYKALGKSSLSILWWNLLGTICEEKWQRGWSRIYNLQFVSCICNLQDKFLTKKRDNGGPWTYTTFAHVLEGQNIRFQTLLGNFLGGHWHQEINFRQKPIRIYHSKVEAGGLEQPTGQATNSLPHRLRRDH